MSQDKAFDWTTEEDDEPWSAEPNSPQRRSRLPFWLLTLLIVVGALGFGAYTVQNQVQEQVDTALNAVESDVIRSFDLLYQASASADNELFTGFLSGRDPDWAAPLQEKVIDGGILDRSGYGLTLQTETPTVISVVLSPNLSAAEVWSAADYVWTDDDGTESAAKLVIPHIMRKGVDRWLYSPPTLNYWGELVQVDGHPLQIENVRTRDQVLARQLLGDLNAQIYALCEQDEALDCVNYAKMINFSTRPSTLVWVQSADNLNRSRSRLLLPSPSILGLPANDLSYDGVLHAYSSVIMPVVAQDLAIALAAESSK